MSPAQGDRAERHASEKRRLFDEALRRAASQGRDQLPFQRYLTVLVAGT